MNISIIEGVTFIACNNRRDMLKLVYAARIKGYTYTAISNSEYALYNEDGYFAFYVKVNIS
jgi:hypothetical protein